MKTNSALILCIGFLALLLLCASGAFAEVQQRGKYQWEGNIDEVHAQDSRVVVADRSFSMTPSVQVYAKDGTVVPASNLREGMQVGCVVDSQFNLQQVWILK